MIKGTSDYLKQFEDTHVCAYHQEPIRVVWYGDENTYTLRCARGEYPEEITKTTSLIEAYKQGEELPEGTKKDVEKAMTKRPAAGTTTPALLREGLIPQFDLGNNIMLKPDQVQFLKEYAYKYGLDPYRQHVFIIHGQPYIGIDGYIYHAHKSGISFGMAGRPLTLEELQARGYQEGDIGFLSTVTRQDTGAVFEGLGIVTKDEMNEIARGKPGQKRYPVLASKPGPMVVKRADWQALRRAFPIGDTVIEEED